MKGFIKKFYQRFICKHDYHLIGETKEFHTYSDIFIYRCIQTNLELFILQQ